MLLMPMIQPRQPVRLVRTRARTRSITATHHRAVRVLAKISIRMQLASHRAKLSAMVITRLITPNAHNALVHIGAVAAYATVARLKRPAGHVAPAPGGRHTASVIKPKMQPV